MREKEREKLEHLIFACKKNNKNKYNKRTITNNRREEHAQHKTQEKTLKTNHNATRAQQKQYKKLTNQQAGRTIKIKTREDNINYNKQTKIKDK